jgi:hypothetical protein
LPLYLHHFRSHTAFLFFSEQSKGDVACIFVGTVGFLYPVFFPHPCCTSLNAGIVIDIQPLRQSLTWIWPVSLVICIKKRLMDKSRKSQFHVCEEQLGTKGKHSSTAHWGASKQTNKLVRLCFCPWNNCIASYFLSWL